MRAIWASALPASPPGIASQEKRPNQLPVPPLSLDGDFVWEGALFPPKKYLKVISAGRALIYFSMMVKAERT